jgi:hypothetical protein
VKLFPEVSGSYGLTPRGEGRLSVSGPPDHPGCHANFLIAIKTLIENPITIDRTLPETFSSNLDLKKVNQTSIKNFSSDFD